VQMIVRLPAGRLEATWLPATVTKVSKHGIGVVYPNGLRLTYSKKMKAIRKVTADV
jgi:hypothetical protein